MNPGVTKGYVPLDLALRHRRGQQSHLLLEGPFRNRAKLHLILPKNVDRLRARHGLRMNRRLTALGIPELELRFDEKPRVDV